MDLRGEMKMTITKARREFDYLLKFTKSYQETADKHLREAYSLKMQTAHIIVESSSDELIVGRVKHGIIGFSPQYGGSYTYYFHQDIACDLYNKYSTQFDDAPEIKAAIDFWSEENTLTKLNRRFSEKHSDLEAYKETGGHMGEEYRLGSGSTPTGRLALTIPDLDKLIRLGIPGLKQELATKNSNSNFITALDIAIDTIVDAIELYLTQVTQLLKQQPNQENLQILKQVLSNIRHQAPSTFIEGLQLYWIYAVFSDLMNHGRMDVYLGDLYAADLAAGRINEETAIKYLTALYGHYKYIGKVHDTRVVIGGRGRRNESHADKLALVIMETSRRVKDVVPQLTLRYYAGMNEALFDKALEVNAQGCSFPLLYSDDTNIPAVMSVFDIPEEDANTYIPAGCGEYVLEALSVNTPNSGVNLLKALELALHNGKDCYYDKIAGPDTGNVEDFDTFDKLWHAFTKQIDHELAIVAWGQKECYNLIEENGSFLHLSLLMNDCVDREKALFDGGVRYLDGCTEIMGMISAADSISAIKHLVYDQKVMSLRQLVTILDANFKGYDKEWQMMKDSPKYGNDNQYADAIAMEVYEYTARKSMSFADIIDMRTYNIVSVNNSESAIWGNYTMASACGRKAHSAMANANGASIGADKNGVTSLLNSMSKFNHNLHVGVINNVRFTKSLFDDSYDKIKILIRTFLENNGNQINLMVISPDDLIAAKNNPQDYQNLIIRIGGFSARFVELDPLVQEELIQRTTYAS